LKYARAKNVEPYIAIARLNEDVHVVLDALRDFKKTVCTNKSISVPTTLKRAGTAHCFYLVITARGVKRLKSHPETLLVIINHFRIRPYKALFVRNSFVDLHCAQAAKVPFLGYRNPDIHAYRNIHSMDQLFDYLGISG